MATIPSPRSSTARGDGRALDALREIRFETGYIAHHPGSVLVSFGATKVLCVATAEERVPPHRKESGGGWVTAEYAMLPGSTHDRKQRERQKQDGRSVEIQRLIGRAIGALAPRTRGSIVFTFAPRTPLLAAMRLVGRLLPRSDRSPSIVPVAESLLRKELIEHLPDWTIGRDLRVSTSFYKSHSIELCAPGTGQA